MRCHRCRRQLLRPTPDGYGPRCRARLRREPLLPGVRQVPVLPAKTEEQTELEILRAQVRPSIAPLESAAENPGVGSRT